MEIILSCLRRRMFVRLLFEFNVIDCEFRGSLRITVKRIGVGIII